MNILILGSTGILGGTLSLFLNQKLNYEAYKCNMGLPFEKIMYNMNIKGNHKEIKKMYVKFSEENIKKIKILDNKLKELKKLKKDNHLAIFTSKDRKRTLKILEKYNLFEMYVTSDDIKDGKPSPEGLYKILAKFKVTKRNCYYIGDTIHDYKSAKKAKINYFYATWGIEKRLNIKKVKYIKSISEIKRII